MKLIKSDNTEAVNIILLNQYKSIIKNYEKQ